MTKVPLRGEQVTNKGNDRPVDPAAYRAVMILADRPVLFDRDVAELAEVAKNLGLRIEIERFDLEENKYSSFVLG